jgi:hypothetical protein
LTFRDLSWFAWQAQLGALDAETLALEGKLESASKARCEAQLQVSVLEEEVSMLRSMLADAKADVQTRLEQLKLKLAGAERVTEELVEREAEALRKFHAVSQQAAQDADKVRCSLDAALRRECRSSESTRTAAL